MRRKIVFLPYDFDTAIGINNEGTLEFSYNLEDIDQTEGGADIFNGQQSVLWKNLRATYFDELRSMFQTLRSTGALSYEKVERMFEEHQAKWPEAVFNEDAWFKYLAPLVEKGNASYLSMLQGSKAEQRKWWLYNRFRYMDSKYNAGDSLSDVITVRGYAKSNITVEPYADVYASVKYGSYLVQKRAARHTKTTLECPLDNVNDTEIYIYSASQLMDVGDLSGLLVGYADFSKAVRLQSLKLGDASASYTNGNLKELYLGNNELLRTIDVRNCPALTQAVVITGCSNIEHVYFDGTSITGLELPDGGILKTLHLPSTMTALSILNQPSLSEFVFPASDALTTLRLENVGTIDFLAMVRAMPANARVRLIGFNWNLSDFAAVMDLYDYFDTKRGIDENGSNLDRAQLYGTIHVPAMTTDQLREARARYSDVNIAADAWTYRVRFFDGDTLLHTEYISAGGDATDPVTGSIIPKPEKPASGRTGYSYNGWDKPLTNITADRDFYAQYIETHAYEVRFQNYDGTLLISKLVPEGQTCPDPVQASEIPVPTRPGDANYVYSFLGWTGGGLFNITSDRVLTAAYSEVRSYTIRFLNNDNSVLLTLYLQQNAQIPNPIQTGLIATPTRARDATYEYTFSKWSNAGTDGFTFGTVSSNKDFTAQYTSRNYYRYTYKDWNGAVLLEEIYYSGNRVTDPIADDRLSLPTREPDETYNYFFWKWNQTFPRTANAHLTITAMYHTDAVHTVTFVNWDDSVLDIQNIQDGSNAVEPIAAGRISTPLRPSTAANEYTFKQWNTTFTEITADKTVKATYTAATRSYYVTFMDGTEQMAQVLTLYGKQAEYPGWPVKTNDALKYLTTWSPATHNVQADLTTYATWAEANITDSWAEIFAAELDGTYKTKYHIGDIKLLDLGSDGIVPMRIVAFDKDILADGSGYAPITWIAVTAPSSRTTSIILPTLRTQNNKKKYDFYEYTDDEGVYYKTTFTTSTAQARGQFTVMANEDAEFTLRMYGRPTSDGSMMLFENDIPIYAITNTAGYTKDFNYSLKAGESIRLTSCFTLNISGNSNNYGMIRFFTENDISISLENLAVLNYAQEQVYSWAECYLRIYLNRYFLPRLPENVRNNVKLVTKYSATTKTPTDEEGFVETEDLLWIPSKTELNPTASYNDFILSMGPKYDDFFTNTVSSQDPKRYFYRKGAQTPAFLRDMIKGDADYSWANAWTPGNGQLRNETAQSVNSSASLMIGFCT